MTYRDLLEKLSQFTVYQLNCTVTVEDKAVDECYPAELKFAGEDHSSLDEDHPVLSF